MKIDDRVEKLPQAGTYCFMAPEVILGEPSDYKQDVWSLGIFLYACLSGSVPFFGSDDKETCRSVVYHSLEFREEVWSGVSPSVKSLLTQMLEKD